MLKQVLSALVVSSVMAGGAALAAEPATGAQASKTDAVTASVSTGSGTHAKKHGHSKTVHKAAATGSDMSAGTAPAAKSSAAPEGASPAKDAPQTK